MDFDEYEYLEKTVENPDVPSKDKESANGNGIEKERSRRSKHGLDESERESDHHRSKRSRSDDRERSSSRPRSRSREDRHRRDNDRDRERSSSRHRSQSREDRHRRDKDRDREERNGKDKDRDRENDREREKRREREREIEKEMLRSRKSRSRSERNRDEDRDRRERSRDRELREREREKELRARDGRRYRDKKEEVAEPEADPERDQRTVFAYQINLKADERDVYEFFSRAGKVRDVRLIMDRNSRRSKGVGYIEFYDAMSVPMAIALSGQPLRGQAVMVKPSEAEKNLVQSTTTATGAGGVIGPYSGGARRLYVGNLHFNITEDQLRQVFEPFGTVELVQLPLDETGHCKGFGFVQFARLEDARNAQNLNGLLEIAGRVIKVSAVSDQVGMQDIGANAADFDDDEGGGMSLNAQSRAALMQKLDRSGTSASVAGMLANPAVHTPALSMPTASVLGAPPVVTPALSVPTASVLGAPPLVTPLLHPTVPGLQAPAMPIASITTPVGTVGVPSECLLLKNMFDPTVETEPDFDLDIKEDVQDECQKFGTVKHIFVDKNSAGHVYLRFDNVNSAMGAQRALHGRWFAGKMITATYMLPLNYEAKFPTT